MKVNIFVNTTLEDFRTWLTAHLRAQKIQAVGVEPSLHFFEGMGLYRLEYGTPTGGFGWVWVREYGAKQLEVVEMTAGYDAGGIGLAADNRPPTIAHLQEMAEAIKGSGLSTGALSVPLQPAGTDVNQWLAYYKWFDDRGMGTFRPDGKKLTLGYIRETFWKESDRAFWRHWERFRQQIPK